MKHKLIFAMFITVLTTVACKKGDDGLPGADGKPGTANVKYSEWFTANPWKKDTIFGIWGFNYIKPAPAITQQILDSGTVITFAKLLGYNPAVWPTGEVGQMPIDIVYKQSGSTQTDNWSAKASVGNLKIRFVNNTNEYNVIATQHQFRYIIIPGGLPAGRGTELGYKEICQLYNIPE